MNPSLTDLLPLAAFAFVMSITPGPNNLMLLNSGVRFGVRRSMPHVLGITVGFGGLIAVAFAGVATLVLLNPGVMTVLTVCCVLYLLWLAWQLVRAPRVPTAAANTDAATDALQPMSFVGAGLFQFVNPKGWAMAVASVGITAHWPVEPALGLTWLLLVAMLINLPCVLVWMIGGAMLRRLLGSPGIRRAFDFAMAALVVATALWMLLPLADTMGS
jgi:threonine/homoserine/homoserine lactone efflux protein